MRCCIVMRLTIAIAVMACLLAGCTQHRTETTTVTTVRETRPAESSRPDLDQLVTNVQSAPDGPSEAAALKRLHDWLADHHLTYWRFAKVQRTGDPDASPSQSTQPLIVTVSIYQGELPVRDFSFVPRDNRNLTMLGFE
jgi:hypothetical protein